MLVDADEAESRKWLEAASTVVFNGPPVRFLCVGLFQIARTDVKIGLARTDMKYLTSNQGGDPRLARLCSYEKINRQM